MDGSPQVVKVKGRIRVSASEGMRSAVLEGLGVAGVQTWLFTDEIERGILQRVLSIASPIPCRPRSSPLRAAWSRQEFGHSVIS